MNRINVTLDDELEDVDPDARQIADLLDRIPGARERIAAGLADLDARRTVPLDQL